MTGTVAALLAVVALQGNPDSALAEYRRRVAYEQEAWAMGRACVSDTVRLYREAGRSPQAAARSWATVRARRDSSMRQVAYESCLASLTGADRGYTPPPMPLVAARAANRPPPRSPPFSNGAFGTFTWVFYADLALGTLLGAVVALFQARSATKGWRIGLTVMGGAVGGMIGAAVFIPFMFLSALFMFLNPSQPLLLFGMTALVIVVGAGGAVAGLLSRKRRGSTMADYKRSLGLKDR